MFSRLRSLLFGEQGASLVEYALLVALIALVVITVNQLLGQHVSSLFNKISGSI